MALEIERKYLVNDSSYKTLASGKVEIRQGYLNRDPERTVRVRTFGDKGFLTVKGKNRGEVRLEFEYEVPISDALEMLALCGGDIVEKIRYFVDYDGLTWEVDEYIRRLEGLVVAEVELPAEGCQVVLPPFVGEEVTGDPRYYNSNL